MSPRAIDRAVKETYQFVTFLYGPGYASVARYTDWTQDTLGFISNPSMEVKVGRNSGALDRKKPTEIELPLDAFTTAASEPRAFSDITVIVQEFTRSLTPGDQATNLTPFIGTVTEVVRNPDGRSDAVMFEALPDKALLDVELGMVAQSHCTFTLFGRGCQLTKVTTAAVVDSIDPTDPKVAIVSSPALLAPTAPGGDASRHWHRGHIEYDGIRLEIKDWSDSAPTRFFLYQSFPTSWVGPSLTFVPGCDKSIERCRAQWDNEDNAGHFGYAMLPYNPLIECGE